MRKMLLCLALLTPAGADAETTQGSADIRSVVDDFGPRVVRQVLSARLCIFQAGLKESRRTPQPSDDIETPERFEQLIAATRAAFAEVRLSPLPCSDKIVKMSGACLSSINGLMQTPLGCPQARGPLMGVFRADQAIPLEFERVEIDPLHAEIKHALEKQFGRAWVGEKDDWAFENGHSFKAKNLYVRVAKGPTAAVVALLKGSFAEQASAAGYRGLEVETPGSIEQNVFPLQPRAPAVVAPSAAAKEPSKFPVYPSYAPVAAPAPGEAPSYPIPPTYAPK